MRSNQLLPGVSVVVTTFQRPESATRLVEQLLAQEGVDGPMEILVVNDNGGPAVFERLARITAGPIAVRLFDTGYEGYGPALARNAGLRFARYDTTVFLDDDVSIGPDLVARYQSAPAGARLGRIDFAVEIDGRRENIPDRRAALRRGDSRLLGAGRECLLLLWSANFCISTAAGLAIGGFDEAYLDEGQEDADFGARIITATGRLVVVPSARVVHDGPDEYLREKLGLPVRPRPAHALERLHARRSTEANGGLRYWQDAKWHDMPRRHCGGDPRRAASGALGAVGLQEGEA